MPRLLVTLVAMSLIMFVLSAAVYPSWSWANEAVSDVIPSEEQLINKLSSHEQLFTRIKLRGESKTRSVWRGGDRRGGWAGYTFEYERDGEQTQLLTQSWGSRIGGRSYSRARPLMERRVFDGNRWCYLVYPDRPSGQQNVRITRTPEAAEALAEQKRQEYSQLLLLDNSEAGWVNLLRAATSIEVLPESQRVGRFTAVVLEADTDEGRVKLWFSVDHDFALVRAQREAEAGDVFELNRLPQGAKYSSTVQALRLSEHSGVWLPIRLESESKLVTNRSPARTMNISSTGKTEISLIEFIPDTRPPQKFPLPTLPVGTRVDFDDDVNPNGSVRFYVWDGEQMIPE